MIKLNDKYAELKAMFKKIIKHNPSYGKLRIKQALYENYKKTVNPKLILKLLKIWGLSLKRKLPKKNNSWITKTLDFLEMRANLLRALKRLSKLTQCLQVLVSDVTMIEFNGVKAYLCVHMDYIGKAVLGWDLSLNPNTALVNNSFKKAIVRLKRFGFKNFKGVIQHQDRGSVYTSFDYITKVMEKGMLLSYSRKGEPGDNAVNESFFSRFKAEWSTEFIDCNTFEELYSVVKHAILYYNYSRHHSSIGYNKPMLYLLTALSHIKT
jgi:putative transposase